MRKLLALVMIAFWAMPINAKDGDQITLQAGSANVIWTVNSAYFAIDYSEVNVEGMTWNQWLHSKGDDFVADWPEDEKKWAIISWSALIRLLRKREVFVFRALILMMLINL